MAGSCLFYSPMTPIKNLSKSGCWTDTLRPSDPHKGLHICQIIAGIKTAADTAVEQQRTREVSLAPSLQENKMSFNLVWG